MNRTGLFIALGLAALSMLIFALFPGLDLALARLFFDAETGTFPWQANGFAAFLRDGAMWLSWAIAAPSIVAVVVKLIWPNKPLLVKGRTVAFFLITIIMSAGVLSNAGFKGHWGRPRPSDVIEFRGPWHFKNWWGLQRRVSEELFVFLWRSLHRVLDLCAGGAGAAAVKALRLCRRDHLRHRDRTAPHDLRRPFPERRGRRRPRHVPDRLAVLCHHLSLARDTADG